MSKNWKNKSWEKAEKKKAIRKSSRKTKANDKGFLEEDFVVSSDDFDRMTHDTDDYFRARVVEVHKRYAFISPEPEAGEIHTKDVWLATVARKFLQAKRTERNFVAVGDLVLCKVGGEGLSEVSDDLPSCTIEARATRDNTITRLSPLRNDLKHVIACNLDRLVIVASLIDPKVKWGLIDRYLTLAESEGLNAVIVLTKKDLLDDPSLEDYKEECLEYVKIYQDIGYEVHMVQANVEADSGHESIETIRSIFRDKICLVSGHSGVGKSSLVNLLEPEIEQEVEEDEIFYKGRHTTTYSSLIKLGAGGYVVDTPGIRSFLIEERDHHELAYCFKELRPFLGKCKYRECRHIDEPDCAVKQAVADGQVSEWRYKSFLAILLGATGREGRMRDIVIEE